MKTFVQGERERNRDNYMLSFGLKGILISAVSPVVFIGRQNRVQIPGHVKFYQLFLSS